VLYNNRKGSVRSASSSFFSFSQCIGVKEVFKEAVKAGVEAVNDRLTLGNKERKEKEAHEARAKERSKEKEKEKEKERDAKGKGAATPTKSGSPDASPTTPTSNVKVRRPDVQRMSVANSFHFLI
jgi:hypothetical protein